MTANNKAVNQLQDRWPIESDHLSPVEDKTWLFRHVNGNWVRFETFGIGSDPAERSKDVFEGLQQARALFEELETKHGIKNAGFYPAVAHTIGDAIGGMVVSNSVEGRAQKASGPIPDAQIPAAKALFFKLSEYLRDKHGSGEYMLTDVSLLEQYVYVPENDEFVLVDTDPYFDSGLIARQIFYDDLTYWGKEVLSAEEFDQWRDSMPQKLNIDFMPERLHA